MKVYKEFVPISAELGVITRSSVRISSLSFFS